MDDRFFYFIAVLEMKHYQPPSQTSFKNYTESNNQIPSIDRYPPYYNPEDKYLSPLSPSTPS